MAFWKPSQSKSEPDAGSTSAPVASMKPKIAQLTQPTASKTVRQLLDAAGDDAEPQNKGFDPYNSGAFNFKDTWSRVNRKK